MSFPGVTILKSHDLVNWEYCCNAVPRFDFSPCYDLEGCNRYGHGQWATSLKYHNGKFYLLFITLDEGGFLCTATKPEGPWQIRKLPKGFYDPGLFFDDDGRIYVAHGYNKIHVTELDTNFAPKGNDSLVYTGDIRRGLEGTHVYKINGYYYLYCTYGGLDGFQAALRSKNIYGPYEQKVVITGHHAWSELRDTSGSADKNANRRMVDHALCRQRTIRAFSVAAAGDLGGWMADGWCQREGRRHIQEAERGKRVSGDNIADIRRIRWIRAGDAVGMESQSRSRRNGR